MNVIKKYFWGLKAKALKETLQILKDPRNPKFLPRIFTLLSRCDKPKELFSLMSRGQFVETWPALRRYWLKIGQAQDFRFWWESIYEQLTSNQKRKPGAAIKELQSVGKIIMTTRQAKGLSQGDLAELSGIRQPDISKIEKGKENITLVTLIRLCRTLELKELILSLA
jgi:DNA-binding Xre family transcriptional regulator